MSEFKIEVCKLNNITSHPNADKLEMCEVNGCVAIFQKGSYQEGDLAVVVIEDSVVPDEIRDDFGLKKNRVKPIRLRGIYSDCILLKPDPSWVEGQDVQNELNIVKYEQPVNAIMYGNKVKGNHQDKCVRYDLENYKKFKRTLENLTCDIVLTEKIHGTWCQISIFDKPVCPDQPFPNIVVTSKGLAKNGQILEQDGNHVYARILKKYKPFFDTFAKFSSQYVALELVRIAAKIRVGQTLTPGDINFLMRSMTEGADFFTADPFKTYSLHIIGEVFGSGVQDLTYGMDDIDFRVFDIGYSDGSLDGNGNLIVKFIPTANVAALLDKELFVQSMNDSWLDEIRELAEVSAEFPKMVPILYSGPYSEEVVQQYTNGSETVNGTSQIREGVVIKPIAELEDSRGNRIAYKSVSEDYKLRKNATEYN